MVADNRLADIGGRDMEFLVADLDAFTAFVARAFAATREVSDAEALHYVFVVGATSER
ncbi:MAG: hypothetical protein ROR55_10665 [Devosia sp.]